MPLIFLHQCNNSAISARIDYGEHYGDEGEFGVKRIQKRSAGQRHVPAVDCSAGCLHGGFRGVRTKGRYMEQKSCGV